MAKLFKGHDIHLVFCSKVEAATKELMGFPGGSDGKESACNAGDASSVHGSGRSPGEGNSNSFQYSCLENSMDRGAWQATVLGVARVGHHLVTKPPPLPEVLMYP